LQQRVRGRMAHHTGRKQAEYLRNRACYLSRPVRQKRPRGAESVPFRFEHGSRFRAFRVFHEIYFLRDQIRAALLPPPAETIRRDPFFAEFLLEGHKTALLSIHLTESYQPKIISAFTISLLFDQSLRNSKDFLVGSGLFRFGFAELNKEITGGVLFFSITEDKYIILWQKVVHTVVKNK
ncbi:MAG: hypothetical protein IJR51_01055, partial [Clostridia bacterium]|nr:hypothetical protein [Clostridia bacterium]